VFHRRDYIRLGRLQVLSVQAKKNVPIPPRCFVQGMWWRSSGRQGCQPASAAQEKIARLAYRVSKLWSFPTTSSTVTEGKAQIRAAFLARQSRLLT
jgi:hypothetical protein